MFAFANVVPEVILLFLYQLVNGIIKFKETMEILDVLLKNF